MANEEEVDRQLRFHQQKSRNLSGDGQVSGLRNVGTGKTKKQNYQNVGAI